MAVTSKYYASPATLRRHRAPLHQALAGTEYPHDFMAVNHIAC